MHNESAHSRILSQISRAPKKGIILPLTHLQGHFHLLFLQLFIWDPQGRDTHLYQGQGPKGLQGTTSLYQGPVPEELQGTRPYQGLR